MGRAMKMRSLMNKLLTRFNVCVAILLVLATPLFYWLTTNFYAEDMISIIEAVQQGVPLPATDLEEDVMEGILLQFMLIAVVLGISVVLTLSIISKRLWKPFDQTLQVIETFRLEDGTIPALPDSEIKEFARLNDGLSKLMTDNLNSYRIQKEFTENASHELQTPLAVMRSKLDILLQQPHLTQDQATIIQDLYQTNNRLSRLSRNLLLLAKMENNQFSRMEHIDVVALIKDIQTYLENLSEGLILKQDFAVDSLPIEANRSLLESMINNLIVNAVRHNKAGGEITISLKENQLAVCNTSDEPPMDETLIFNRFYRSSEKAASNGLGLSIVKAVCDYHGWKIAYNYRDGKHEFAVKFV